MQRRVLSVRGEVRGVSGWYGGGTRLVRWYGGRGKTSARRGYAKRTRANSTRPKHLGEGGPNVLVKKLV